MSDDDFLFSARDLSSFELEIHMAVSKVQVKDILERFVTTEEYFINTFPELAAKVADLPD